jgi:hypothetical protein
MISSPEGAGSGKHHVFQDVRQSAEAGRVMKRTGGDADVNCH